MNLALVPELPGGPSVAPTAPPRNPPRDAYDPQDTKIRPWMKAYAAWLAVQSKHPVATLRLAYAKRVSKLQLTPKMLRQLEHSEPFLAVLQQYMEDDYERARSIVARNAEKAVKAHFRGLKMALQAKDHRAITNYTVPILDRVAPKKTENAQTTNIVTIHLGKPESFAAKTFSETPAVDVEYEIVPPEARDPEN